MDKQKSSTTSVDWVKCQSKSRPGRFYYFNTSTGETKWCPVVEQTDTPDSNEKQDKSRANIEEVKSQSSSKEQIKPKWSFTKPSRTPAQDRLKRLQSCLKKSDLKKEPKEKNNNQSGSSSKLNSHIEFDKNLRSKRKVSNAEKSDEPPAKMSVSPSTSVTKKKPTTPKAAATKLNMNSKTLPPVHTATQTSITTPKSASPKKQLRRGCKKRVVSLPLLPMAPDLLDLENVNDSQEEMTDTENGYESNEEDHTRERTEQITEKSHDDKDAASTSTMSTTTTMSFKFGNGIVSKIKELCKNTYNSITKQTSEENAIKLKPILKSPRRRKPISVEQALKDLREKWESKRERLSATPFTEAHVLGRYRKSPSPASATPKKVAKSMSLAFCSTAKPTLKSSYNKESANARLERLRQSMDQQPSTSRAALPIATLYVPPAVPGFTLNRIGGDSNNAHNDFEAMDWETTDNGELQTIEISSEASDTNVHQPTQAKRQTHNCSAGADSTVSEYFDMVNENLLRLSAEKVKRSGITIQRHWLSDHYYFVLDTNVLLQHLMFIDDLSKMKLCDTNGTVLYIPYCVLQELDKLKIRAGSEGTKILSRRAIKFLNDKFEAKSKHIQAQSAIDERQHLIAVDTADDSIINCCLQLKQNVDHLVLLTEDANLRNKAFINSILASTKSDLISRHVRCAHTNALA